MHSVNRFFQTIMLLVMLLALPAMGQSVADKQIELTAEEAAWLGSHKDVSVAVSSGWAPVEFLKKDNQFAGIAVDYLQLLETKLPLHFHYVRSTDNTLDNQTEMLSAVANPQSLTQSHYQAIADPYLQMPFVIFVRKETGDVSKLADLAGRKVAVFKYGSAARALAKNNPDIELVGVNLADDALLMLIEGKVDAYIGNLTVISYVAQNLGIGELKIAAKTPYGAEIYMAVDKQHPLLSSILSKALRAISDEERNHITSKWVTVTYEHHTDYRTLLLTVLIAAGVILVISLWGWQLNREVKRRKIIESELVLAKEKAEAANKAKSAFLASMSHELRTPLNAILGFGQLLVRSKELSDLNHGSAEEIVHAGNHLLALINGLLDLSKIESGKLTMEMSVVNIQPVIDQAVVTISTLANERQISLSKHISAVFYVEADKTRLKQVLLNLLSNAIKYNRENGHVDISAEKQADKVIISVADTGRGIADSQFQEVFEPFQRLDAEMSNIEGTGIGLSITKHIINEMGGAIEVESVVGKGSTFRIILSLVETPSEMSEHNG